MTKLSGLGEQFYANGKAADCPIYDLHGHMGPVVGIHLPFPDTDSMIARMEKAGVALQVFCHHATLFSADFGNEPNIEAVGRYPNKLRAYCGVNPNYPDMIAQDLESFDEYKDVYVGFKMLADYHGIPLTDDRYKPAWEKADRDGLMVLLHTWGGSPYNGYAQVRKVAETYPHCKILMGHCLRPEWDHAIEIAQNFPNVYLELCSVLRERGAVEQFVDSVGSERIIFGTDTPWFDYHYYIGTILDAGISDEDRRNIFYRNAQKLLSTYGL